MYLSRLIIRNFRSIKNLDLQFCQEKNVIIGRNNSGKSNIIKALDKILGSTSPTWAKSENITEKDFYTWKESVSDGEYETKSDNSLFIFCELTRDTDEVLNWDSIYKCSGFYLLTNNGRYGDNFRLPKDSIMNNYEEVFKITQESDDKRYINPKLRHQKTFEDAIGSMYSFGFCFMATKTDDGEVQSKEIRFLFRESKNHDWCIAFSAPIRNELIQSAILPSFRDPQNQLRPTKWTWYGKLMIHLTKNHEVTDELNEAFEKVKNAANKIFTNFKQEITKSTIQVAFPDTELFFQFHADAKQDIHKSCMIFIDDGYKSELSEKGSGIQSATIIGLFQYYTNFVDTQGSALLCVEEPEIYLHPHARRAISNRLDSFLSRKNNQVIITTHCVEFLKPNITAINLILVRSTKNGTCAESIQLNKFRKLIVDNNQNELFFADKVIICEGYDEYIVRAIASEKFGSALDDKNISIVAVGGKDKIAELSKLIIKLGIKCFVIADFDYLLRDKTDLRKEYNAEAHDSILNLGLEYFRQECICGPQMAPKVISSISKLRNEIKQKNERGFYTAKSADEIQHVRLSEGLDYLRKNGTCILNGEVEHLSKQPEFISPDNKKINLQKIYQLHEKICDGEKIDNIIEANQIIEFLNIVFER